ncbi:DUF4041 domain-containing protein [Nocardioides mangrovicus]|uniref:DUF4041 domain-containing protein n=1 Tax=Nocardioides mangrovicus TaxID=2478913 RepID=A0A3L8P068_9ACTN|nr:DUF4041 domain-containing protein [Nocardioides mangrovicus]RLV48307.1 DUF4041 domain-containing protein [Nocardioides mangrovicus]
MTAPAGWYPDTQQPGQQRYWDGQQWTEHRAPLTPHPTAASTSQTTSAPTPQPTVAATAPSTRPSTSSAKQTANPAVVVSPETATTAVKIPLFGARKAAREASSEVERLEAELASFRAEMARLGALDVVELQRERDDLQTQIKQADAMLKLQREEMVGEAQRARAEMQTESNSQRERLQRLRTQIVTTEETAVLQEAGIYRYQHPLENSVEYKEELSRLQDQIKVMVRANGGAVTAAQDWTVNGSAAQGRSMVRDYSKLMLRAYNAEADNLVRGLKPYKLATAKDRLEKVVSTIERLGKTMQIRITPSYHRLRLKELELTADYQEKLAREKEQEREEKQRLREERIAQQEMDRERYRLRKEREHYCNVLDKLIANGDVEAADRMRVQLHEVDRAIEDVDYRAANIRAGYVYVISNLGSFGERMVKIGMTRRLEPMDRVRELSDASVPFNFDVHALFFSDDAVGIETAMHQHFADKRVNHVNHRREFFYATPIETRAKLLELTGDLLQFEETPLAVEFRQSNPAAVRSQASPTPDA